MFGLKNMKLKVLLNPHCLHPCPPLINYEKSKVSFCKIIKPTHEKKNANIQSDEQLLLKKRRKKQMNFCAIILPVCVVLVQNHDYYYVFTTNNTCCKML